MTYFSFDLYAHEKNEKNWAILILEYFYTIAINSEIIIGKN